MALQPFISYLSLEKNYSWHTVNAYQRDIGEFVVFCTGEYGSGDIEEIDYNMVRSWIINLVERNISNRTINRKIASLNAYYKFLLKIERIGINPLAQHKALKTPRKIEVPFSELEMQEVLMQISFNDDFEGVRDKLIIELLYTTGIRRAELINLKFKDVDVSKQTLKVLGKRNKERIIPLLPSTLHLFTVYCTERDRLEKIIHGDYIFLLKSGNKIYGNLVYRVINRYFGMVSTKVKKSPHIIRHTFATHLLNKGADLNSVKELLGHSSLASTQVYTHNSIAELKKVHLTAHPRNKE